MKSSRDEAPILLSDILLVLLGSANPFRTRARGDAIPSLIAIPDVSARERITLTFRRRSTGIAIT